jgi:hypothetical protein
MSLFWIVLSVHAGFLFVARYSWSDDPSVSPYAQSLDILLAFAAVVTLTSLVLTGLTFAGLIVIARHCGPFSKAPNKLSHGDA